MLGVIIGAFTLNSFVFYGDPFLGEPVVIVETIVLLAIAFCVALAGLLGILHKRGDLRKVLMEDTMDTGMFDTIFPRFLLAVMGAFFLLSTVVNLLK